MKNRGVRRGPGGGDGRAVMETLPGDQSQRAMWAGHRRHAGNGTSRSATRHGHRVDLGEGPRQRGHMRPGSATGVWEGGAGGRTKVTKNS